LPVFPVWRPLAAIFFLASATALRDSEVHKSTVAVLSERFNQIKELR